MVTMLDEDDDPDAPTKLKQPKDDKYMMAMEKQKKRRKEFQWEAWNLFQMSSDAIWHVSL